MKLNAYSFVGNRPANFTITLMLASLALLVSSILLLFHSYNVQDDITANEKRLEILQEKNSNFDIESLPKKEDLINIKLRSNKARKLSVLTSNHLLKTLYVIENNIPNETSISRLNSRRDTGFVEIISEAKNNKSLNIFLKSLEKEPYFEKVLLKQQGKRTSNKSKLEQYIIHLHVSQGDLE